MLRRLWICLATLLVFTAVAQAQDAEFNLWLYESQAALLTRVDSLGAILDTFTLPYVDTARETPSGVAVSPNGDRFAYALTDATTLLTRLYIYERSSNTILVYYDLGTDVFFSMNYASNSFIFSEDGGAIAFATATFDTGWHLQAVGIDSPFGYEITSSSPGAASVDATATVIPVPMYYRDEQVAFFLVIVASDGVFRNPSYVWDLMSETISANPAFTGGYSDISPTGEVITALPDDRFGFTTTDAWPFGQANTLQVYRPSMGGLYPFYAASGLNLYSPTFVEGVRRIFAPFVDTTNANFAMLVERDGTPSDTMPSIRYYDVAGTLDGLVYLTPDNGAPADTVKLFSMTTSDGVASGEIGDLLWTAASSSVFARIVWISDVLVSSPEPVPEWVRLADPVCGDMGCAMGSVGDLTTPVLRAGVEALINTTEGDQLNIRSGPGTSFSVVARANNGTRVTVLEGPSSGSSLTWWRVRLPDGTEGWAVEVADGVQALVPIAGTGGTTGGTTGTGSAGLRVGGTAEVVTSALNIRTSPSRSATVAEILSRGAVVTVLEGPHSADGLTWWRVRSAAGMDGWAVESFEGNPALVGR